MNQYVIASFYRFIELQDYEQLKTPILNAMNERKIKGTIILSTEGINGSVSGTPELVESLIDYFNQDTRLASIRYSKTYHHSIPFDKAKVKLRKEIVTMGVSHIDPSKQTGIHVKPEEWNQLITDPDVTVIDTRNEYEVLLGTFEHAVDPVTVNFRDFPDYVAQHLMDKKGKKIAMCCTGGIRCEKSTAYLMSLGFEHVYQLDGGILNYLETTPENESLWKGSCFVFDDRIAVDSQLNGLKEGTIDSNWKHDYRKSSQS